MWKSIVKDGSVYLLKFLTDPECFMYLTNMESIWIEQLSKENLALRFKELNPICQTTDVQTELQSIYDNISADSIEFESVSDTNIKLKINCVVDDFKLNFDWDLVKQPSSTFFKEVTLCLINTVQTLENRQERLYNLLEKKDREIDEYIREFGEISRDYLKTTKFNKNKLCDIESNDLMHDILSSDSVVNNFNEKYGGKILKRKGQGLKDEGNQKKLKPYQKKYLKT